MRAYRRNTTLAGHAAWLVLLLAGCAGYSPTSLSPGASADEVIQAMGKPTGEYRLPDGGSRLEFARGPYGKDTYMVDLDAQRRMKGWTQVLTEERFATVRRGMTRDEVLQSIGHPSEAQRIPWQRRELWSYRYETPLCQWFQVGIDRTGQVVDTGYGMDPLCMGNDNNADRSI